jgi:hypothetical protein
MKPKIDEKLEKLTTTIQQKLIGNPALLIGSGGSIPYGLPSMGALASEITNKLETKYQDEETWKAFTAELSRSKNLESALEKVTIREDIQNSIISTVWSLIDKKDREAINGFLSKGSSPALTSILKKFVQCAGATNIVTTNYDRLIEYAIDCSQGIAKTGFSGNCIKDFDSFSINTVRRTVNLYKVHGSIDWFKHKTNLSLMATSFLNLDNLSDVYMPMIVTPGNGKYKETHNNPFRTVIAEADKALRGAGSYLCIGYGFNDEHIQPIIIDENKNKNKPIVIVTKEVTSKMKELFLQNTACNCLIVSENAVGGSLVYYSDIETENFVEDFWCVDSFYKLWLE